MTRLALLAAVVALAGCSDGWDVEVHDQPPQTYRLHLRSPRALGHEPCGLECAP